MDFKYSKEDIEKIKQSLSIDQISTLIDELGGEPIIRKNLLLSKTICHCGKSHKLYYYDNTKLFKCYTECNDTFDIFELICKYMDVMGEMKSYYSKQGVLEKRKWEIFDAIEFIILYFHLSAEITTVELDAEKDVYDEYLQLLENNSLKETKSFQIVEMKQYDKNILNNLPLPVIEPWERDGISRDVMKNRGICFNPKSYGIVIPHYDINNNLVGIRERTLVKENEQYGKYRPAIFNGKMFNHPLGFNLYNLNNSKDNIKNLGKAIVFEGEKGPLQYASCFGIENDISVAVCGFNLLNYQVELLKSVGAREIIIAFDKQYQELGDSEWEKMTKKIYDLQTKYSSEVQLSFIFDKWDLLGYKDSPIDKGKDIFLDLFEKRIIL